jgi:hypothetical protein
MKTLEQKQIISQIERGFGFYGGKYKKATSEKERQAIINKALNN